MSILALDIGGANIKAAHSEGAIITQPFALWRQPQHLADMLREVMAKLPAFEHLAVTTTAELCDCFATKREGVGCVLDATEAVANSSAVHVWQTDGRFVTAGQARDEPTLCAAANWHVLATFVAAMYQQGEFLLVDIGSTTTDIIRLKDGHVAAGGLTDMQRLATGELLYIGASRTSLMALGTKVNWSGKEYNIMAEHFATTEDIFVLLGKVPEQPDSTDTADGRPLTRIGAARRVVRMIGADLEQLRQEDAVGLAQTFVKLFHACIANAIAQVVGGRRIDRIIISGSGASVAEGALPAVPVARLAEKIGEDAASAACAFALGSMLQNRLAAGEAVKG